MFEKWNENMESGKKHYKKNGLNHDLLKTT